MKMEMDSELSDENLLLLNEIKRIVGKLYKRVSKIDRNVKVQQKN